MHDNIRCIGAIFSDDSPCCSRYLGHWFQNFQLGLHFSKFKFPATPCQVRDYGAFVPNVLTPVIKRSQVKFSVMAQGRAV